LKGDLVGACKDALQGYRDAHLAVPDGVMIWMVGGEAPGVVLKAADETLAKIKLAARPPAAAKVNPGMREATWDLDAEHVIMTWPIASPDQNVEEHAAMMTLARLVWMQLAQDQELSAKFGMILAGTDLRCPESDYFFVSGGCKPDVAIAEAGELLATRAQAAIADFAKLPPQAIQQLAAQLALELQPQDLAVLAAQAPNVDSNMLEAQAALTWGTAEYRLGAKRELIAKALKTMSNLRVHKVTPKLAPAKATRLHLKRGAVIPAPASAPQRAPAASGTPARKG
jgi:hypothetical protein